MRFAGRSDYPRGENASPVLLASPWPLPCTRVVLSAGLPQAESQPDESVPFHFLKLLDQSRCFGNLWVPQATSQKAVSSEMHTFSAIQETDPRE